MSNWFSNFCLAFAFMEFTGLNVHLERWFDKLRLECTRILWHCLKWFNVQQSEYPVSHENEPMVIRWLSYIFGIGALGFFGSLVLIVFWAIATGSSVDDVPKFAGEVNFFFLGVIGAALGLLFVIVFAIPVFHAFVWLLHIVNKGKGGTVGSISFGLAMIGWLYQYSGGSH